MVAQQQGLGDQILQIAQIFTQQRQQEKALELRAKQIDDEAKARERTFQLQEKQFALREDSIRIQQENFTAEQAKAAADLQLVQSKVGLTAAQTALTASKIGKGAGGDALTGNQRKTVTEDIWGLAQSLDTQQFIESFNQQNGASIPSFASPEQMENRIQRLSAMVGEFQTDITAGRFAQKARAQLPKGQQLEIDRATKELQQLRALVESPTYQEFRTQLRDKGPRTESLLKIRDGKYSQFADQIDIGAIRNGVGQSVPTFQFKVDQQRIGQSWSFFEEGNVEHMADSVLESTGGVFTQAQAEQLRQDMLRRFPDPGEEQDLAGENYRKLLRILNERKTN